MGDPMPPLLATDDFYVVVPKRKENLPLKLLRENDSGAEVILK